MTPTVLVTGGTGTLGRQVTPRLLAAGCRVRVLSRQRHEPRPGIEYVTGDLRRPDGLQRAVAGATTVLHLAGDAAHDEQTTDTLLRALRGSGVAHLVFISVVAADRVPLGYFRTKLAAERAVADSGLPWTTLRAAQFHELVHRVLAGMARLPVLPVPRGVRAQPVDSGEVADRRVELALRRPAGAVPDLVGPQVLAFDEMARGYLAARGTRRLLVPVRVPGAAGRALRAGHNLASDGAELGTRTWAGFLGAREARPAR